MMNSAFKTRNVLSKTMNFVLKMMNVAEPGSAGGGSRGGLHGGAGRAEVGGATRPHGDTKVVRLRAAQSPPIEPCSWQW